MSSSNIQRFSFYHKKRKKSIVFGKDKKKGQKAYGLFTFMNEEKSDDNVNGYSDEEMDAYDLTDRQKEEVKNGNYDPWSFEEEDLFAAEPLMVEEEVLEVDDILAALEEIDSLEDMPDEIEFNLDKDEKVLKLIPIIKDIDNPENLSNKFKLGIVTSFVKTTKEDSKE